MTDVAAGTDAGSVFDNGSVFDSDVGSDGNILTDNCAVGNDCGSVNSHFPCRRLIGEFGGDISECVVNVLAQNQCAVFSITALDIRRDEDYSRPGSCKHLLVSLAADKCEVGAFGITDTGN